MPAKSSVWSLATSHERRTELEARSSTRAQSSHLTMGTITTAISSSCRRPRAASRCSSCADSRRSVAGGHVNVSPKGLDGTFAMLEPDTASRYLDLTGSGIETVAHVRENGRITRDVLRASTGRRGSCGSSGRGAGHRVRRARRSTSAPSPSPRPPAPRSRRHASTLDRDAPTRAATACPRMELVEQRDRLRTWAESARATTGHCATTGPSATALSIDGLPGF